MTCHIIQLLFKNTLDSGSGNHSACLRRWHPPMRGCQAQAVFLCLKIRAPRRKPGKRVSKNRRINVDRRPALPYLSDGGPACPDSRNESERPRLAEREPDGRVRAVWQRFALTSFGSRRIAKGSGRRLAGADRNDYPAGPKGTGRPDRIRRFVARACPYVRGNPAGGVVTAGSPLVICVAGVGPGGGRRSPGRRAR